MKKLYFLPFLIVSYLSINLSAQNGIDVRGFISPTSGFYYDSSATEAIEVRFRNDGPQDLFGQDTIVFNMSIGTNDTTEFYSIRKRVNTTLSPGDNNTYVLNPAYTFKWENDYTICVSAIGTNFYPNNTTKNARACVSFIVGVDELKLNIDQILFNENRIEFNLNEQGPITAFIFDLTGRVLAEKKLSNGINQSIDFTAPAKGFYFLKVLKANGQSAIAKFVAN